MNQKLVIHYADGRIVRGTTANFSPEQDYFVLTPLAGDPAPPGPGQAGGAIAVELKDLKGIFFVKDLAGRRSHGPPRAAPANQPNLGRRVKVTFQDGEVLLGATPSYDPKKQGFFIFPAEADSNTVKLFAVNAHVRDVRFL